MQVAEAGAPPGGQLMIELTEILISFRRQRSAAREVIRSKAGGGLVRVLVGRGEVLSNRVEQARRNHVPRERGSGSVRECRGRIVDGQKTTRAVLRLREVSDALERRWRVLLAARRLRIAIAFEAEPEERLVLPVVNLWDDD